MEIFIFLTGVVKHEGCCKAQLKWVSFYPDGSMDSLNIFSFPVDCAQPITEVRDEATHAPET